MSVQMLTLNVDAISDLKVKLLAHVLNEIASLGLWITDPHYEPRPLYQLHLFQEQIASLSAYGKFILNDIRLDSDESSQLAESAVNVAASIQEHLESVKGLLDQYARVYNDLAARVYDSAE